MDQYLKIANYMWTLPQKPGTYLIRNKLKVILLFFWIFFWLAYLCINGANIDLKLISFNYYFVWMSKSVQ